MKVIELAFCCYAVTDMKRAREFYEGVLNLKPTTVTDTEHGQWTEYEFGPLRWPSVARRHSSQVRMAAAPRSKWRISILPSHT
jgi:catechol 2,3-dioxygenase-like lactoylglutathione lyase family enzyme